MRLLSQLRSLSHLSILQVLDDEEVVALDEFAKLEERLAHKKDEPK